MFQPAFQPDSFDNNAFQAVVQFHTAFQPNAFQNNAFQIVITPVSNKVLGGDDAWTKEERKRYKALQKKLRIAEEKRIEALKADAESRKKTISDLIDPPKASKSKQNKVQSNQEVSVDIPSNLANIDRYIANLVKQQQDLQTAVAMRNAKLRLEQELAILEAKRQAELDDEEALLLLL
jgi:hypothetical protein